VASANVGVVGMAELNAGMLNNNSSGVKGSEHFSGAAGWTYAWFLGSIAFILFVYFGFGGHRGAVAS
jgi:hypothetical protein